MSQIRLAPRQNGGRPLRLGELTNGLPDDLFGFPAYTSFVIYKRGKKPRRLHKPNKAMKELHYRLISGLQTIGPIMPCATGSVSGGSPRRNVAIHRTQSYIYIVDLKNAFGHVHPTDVARMLCHHDPELRRDDFGRLVEFVENYFFLPEVGLVQGGPASPLLFNLVLDRLVDRKVVKLLSQIGGTYTRYVDDFIFSRHDRAFTAVERARIRQILGAAGFPVNDRKAWIWEPGKSAVPINGLKLDASGRIFLPPKVTDHIAAVLNRAIKQRDIKQEEVAGLMGWFFSATGHRPYAELSQPEKKVVRLYRQWQRRPKAKRRTVQRL